MKKIITLLVSVTMVAAVFAQPGGRDNGYGNNNGYGDYGKGKDVVFVDGKFKDSYVFTPREKDMAIAQINREYDRKIQSVKNRFFMPRFKKEQIIFNLEQDRREEIKQVIMKFKSHKNRYGDFYSKDWDDHDHGRKNW